MMPPTPPKPKRKRKVHKTPKVVDWVRHDRSGGHLVQRGRTHWKDHDEDGAETDAEDHV